MIKKILTLILVFLFGAIIHISPVFGDDSGECPAECKIKDGTPDFLIEYFNTVRKIAGNVKSEVAKISRATGSSTNTSEGRIQKDLMRTFNLFGDWSGYYSTFEFYVKLPLTQNVPYPVKRDQELIEREVDYLTKTLENLVRKNQQDYAIENPCAGVEDICKFEDGPTARGVLGVLLINTKKIGELYRLSILGKEGDTDEDILFVRSDFRKQFVEHYNSFTAETCSRCKGEATERTETAMARITDWSKWSRNGTQRWINAWNMLIGNVSEVKQRDYERQVLAKELSRQGLHTSNSDIIIGNLDRYNNQGFYSIDNNFIENSFTTASNNLGRRIDSFSETLRQKFDKSGKTVVGTQYLAETQQDVLDTERIKNMIDVIYQSELPFASIKDTSSESLQAKLISYHLSLTEVIAELDKIIPTSEKVCNDQANGLGQCSY